MDINTELKDYIEKEIIPRYDSFDKAHQRNHVLSVIEQSLKLAVFFDVDSNMVYTIAAYHDTGLAIDRPNHHLHSGKILRDDLHLRRWFDTDEIEKMAEAVEDHRASSGNAPRSVYGRIVAEADRLIDAETIIRRTIQYGLKYFPQLSKDEQIPRTIQHLKEKYGEGGYLKLWIPQSPNAQKLWQFQQIIKDNQAITMMVKRILDDETNNL